MANAGIRVARKFRRNRKMITTTSTAASTRVRSASAIERLTKTDWSNAVVRCTPGGSSASISGSALWIASDTSIRLALDCRTTPMPTEGLPSKRIAERSSAGPSSTRATSRNLTRTPLLLDTTMLANSSGVLSSPSERTVNSRCVDSIRPAGTSTLRERMAAATSCTARPREDRASGSSQTRME